MAHKLTDEENKKIEDIKEQTLDRINRCVYLNKYIVGSSRRKDFFDKDTINERIDCAIEYLLGVSSNKVEFTSFDVHRQLNIMAAYYIVMLSEYKERFVRELCHSEEVPEEYQDKFMEMNKEHVLRNFIDTVTFYNDKLVSLCEYIDRLKKENENLKEKPKTI